MFSKLITLILVTASLTSVSFAQNLEGLKLISTEVNGTLNELKKPRYSQLQRKQNLVRKKIELGNYFFELMQSNNANDDIEFTKTYRAMANLSLLSKLNINAQDQATKESCADIKSQFSIANLTALEGHIEKLSSTDLLAKELLEVMCGK